MYTVSEIHTGKLGIFLLALLFRVALLLDIWNFSYWHYYSGRHFYSGQEQESMWIINLFQNFILLRSQEPHNIYEYKQFKMLK